MEVVSASHGVLGPLLGKLTALLANECARLKGVRREIRSLKSELTSMQAAVQKYTMLQDPDLQSKAWISLVRELAYDTEDVIDKFIHQLSDAGHQSQSGFKEFFRKTVRGLKTLASRRGIARQIDDLKVRVKEVKELKSSYKLDDATCSTYQHSIVDPRLSALFVEEKHLVGIDGPRDELINWMMEEENSSFKHRRVLSIFGFGGLGKTTLAKEVCHKIQGYFDCHAFVSVSQKPNVKQIMKDVLSQVPSEENFTEVRDTWDERKLVLKLQELLQDKRYLIVIDDIWSIPAWEAIKYAFPENKFSSRIIATTRNVAVARSCCLSGNDRMYEMKALSDPHSKKLFFKRRFGSEDYCPDMLKQVSEEILKKCRGLPLAIISISSLLANKPLLKDEWEKVKRSIGSAMNKNRSLEGMNSILCLSYNDLPPNLKTCLLYLSIFPEDYVIERERLVRRWIAEGFISEERGLSKQEVAENNFYELINKSMIQPVDVGYDGKARACQVHDMMLELIISKSIEDNFVSVVGHRQTDLVNQDGSIRRLSVQHIVKERVSVLEHQDLSHVRSLTVITSSCIKHLPSVGKFETLRVLDFEGCQSLQEYDMKGIDKLFQLKYLSLRGTNISEIPSGIVRLYGLETLDLRNNDIEELPSRIVQLTKLQYLLLARYVFLNGGFTRIPDGIGNMSNLRVITGFNITKSSLGAVAELGNLTSLIELQLQLDSKRSEEYRRHEAMLLSSLCKLGSCKLQSLWIDSNDSTPLKFLDSWSPLPSCIQRFRMSTLYHFPKMPKWITPALSSLAYLNINLVKARQEDLGILGEMPALISLLLTFNTNQEERLTIRGHGFPCLKELYIYSKYGYGAGNLLFEEGAMPKLEKLELPFVVPWAKSNGCYLGIGHLPCLKYATITLHNREASTSENSAAAAAIRNEANAHSNHPRLNIYGERKEVEKDTDTEEETYLVGIDGPREDLVNWMMEEENSSSKHRRVLSIVGFGGQGKTILAKAICHKIQRHFDCYAFVSVSQMPNVKKIMKDVISQVPCKKDFTADIDTWDEKKFIGKLRELLQDKRYLIVIDDIWSIPAWHAIKYAFPENNFSSRIIATTRIVDVARSCCLGGNDRMYEMEALSDLHSKTLFFKRIFGSEDCCPAMLEQVSNEILKKCGGLPQAIISISSLLANKPFLKEKWEKVKRSIGSAMENNRSLEGLCSILSLSYNDLPPNVKTCLLYLSMFPEDYVIERERLVRRWIAEGFISEERGLSKQEVAENNFYELINKSMIQPVDVGYDGKARACRVHDMMLELIISKSIEDNFVSVVGHGQTDFVNRDGSIHRLSVQHIDQELASELENQDLSHVRSLTVATPSGIKHLPSLVKLETLRVLDFEGCQSLQEYDMNGIDKLFQLKYLSLRGTNMSEIPSGIVRLYDLEMLDLRDNYIEELPSRIVQLTKLQYLLLGRYVFLSGGLVTKIPDGIGNMSNLRVITGFNIIRSSLRAVAELGNLTSLNELHLQLDGRGSEEYKRHEEMLLSSLCKLGSCKLQYLWLLSADSTPLKFLDSWSPLPSCLQRFRMTTSYYLPKMPKWITPALASLACLEINLVKLTEEDLGRLGKMPALISLRLTFNTDQEERLTIRGYGFPCLKELYSRYGYGAANLLFEQGALPKLEKLDLPFVVSWTKAFGFYLGIGHLSCLKYATIALRDDGGASPSENRAAAAAIRNEANSHPNHPRLIIYGEMEEGEKDSDTNVEEFQKKSDTNEEES